MSLISAAEGGGTAESFCAAPVAITLSEDGALQWECAVVIERGAPQERAVRHQAGADLGGLTDVAAFVAAGLVGDAEIAGIAEADELGSFAIEFGVIADRVGAGGPGGTNARVDVGRGFFGGIGIAAVAVDAGDVDGGGRVHRLDTDVAFGGLAARGLLGESGCREQEQEGETAH